MENQITTAHGNQTQIEKFSKCSQGLKKLLTTGNDWRSSVAEIAQSQALIAEAKAVLPAIEAALKPSLKAELIKVLVANRVAYGMPDLKDDAWATFWDLYAEVLEGESVATLKAAFKTWNQGGLYTDQADLHRHAFYPKPAELKALCKKVRDGRTMARFRIQEALKWQETASSYMTNEQRQEEVRKAIELGLIKGKTENAVSEIAAGMIKRVAPKEDTRPDFEKKVDFLKSLKGLSGE